jgi:hypothetical protein
MKYAAIPGTILPWPGYLWHKLLGDQMPPFSVGRSWHFYVVGD